MGFKLGITEHRFLQSEGPGGVGDAEAVGQYTGSGFVIELRQLV